MLEIIFALRDILTSFCFPEFSPHPRHTYPRPLVMPGRMA